MRFRKIVTFTQTVNIILKGLGHSFRVGAALDMISQGESLARIMLRGGWKTESTALRYLRNYTFETSVTEGN